LLSYLSLSSGTLLCCTAPHSSLCKALRFRYFTVPHWSGLLLHMAVRFRAALHNTVLCCRCLTRTRRSTSSSCASCARSRRSPCSRRASQRCRFVSPSAFPLYLSLPACDSALCWWCTTTPLCVAFASGLLILPSALSVLASATWCFH
jgi:hypothetical protein